MISARYVQALLVVLVIALLPTVRHGYVGYATETSKIGEATMPAAVDGAVGRARLRTAAWMASTYGADSWAERAYTAPGGGEVSLFVARGFDLKKLYHHPELGVLRGRSFHPPRSSAVAGQPVHVLQNLGDGESAVYALIYEGRWIGNPYLVQVSSAFTSLWSGRQALTLVFVYGRVLRDGQPTPFAAGLLRAAVDRLPPAVERP